MSLYLSCEVSGELNEEPESDDVPGGAAERQLALARKEKEDAEEEDYCEAVSRLFLSSLLGLGHAY